jgi:hypothetical protein
MVAPKDQNAERNCPSSTSGRRLGGLSERNIWWVVTAVVGQLRTIWGLVRTSADKRDMAAIKQAVEDTARVCPEVLDLVLGVVCVCAKQHHDLGEQWGSRIAANGLRRTPETAIQQLTQRPQLGRLALRARLVSEPCQQRQATQRGLAIFLRQRLDLSGAPVRDACRSALSTGS